MKEAVLRVGLLLPAVLCNGACTPEVGSDAWCEQMQEMPAGDWSVNQAAYFARHCLLKPGQEERGS